MSNHQFVICRNTETVRNSHIDPCETLNLRDSDLDYLADVWSDEVYDALRDANGFTSSACKSDSSFPKWNGGFYSSQNNYRGVFVLATDDMEAAKQLIDAAVDAANTFVNNTAIDLSKQNNEFDAENVKA